jgi:pimeloyl-ACP methyl ester carboxylesterase
MTQIRPFALAKELAAIPFYFIQHQWKGIAASKPEKHAFGPHQRQYLLFWMPPPGTPEQHSVVIFYHGGGWRLGWPNQFPTIADYFLRSGFPVMMPAYRLSPKFAYPDMREDLNLALGKILELMQTQGLSSKKLLAAGMSAGGTLAAHLAFNRNELAAFSLTTNNFSGFLSFASPLDLSRMPDVPQVRRFAGGRFDSPEFKAANPMTLLSADENLPILLLHGTEDAIVPFSSSESFYEKYSGPKTLYPIHKGTHFDSLNFALNEPNMSDAVSQWLDQLVRK